MPARRTQQSTAQLNIETVKAFLQAAYSQDIELAASLLADGVELEIAGTGVVSGIHHGRDAFFENFARMQKVTEGTYEMTEQTDWCGSDNHVVLIATERVQRGGREMLFRRSVVYRLTDERIDQVRVYELDPAIADLAFQFA